VSKKPWKVIGTFNGESEGTRLCSVSGFEVHFVGTLVRVLNPDTGTVRFEFYPGPQTEVKGLKP
jgi:hypothetical protein